MSEAAGHTGAARHRAIAVGVVLAALSTGLLTLPALDRFHGIDTDIHHWIGSVFSAASGEAGEAPVVVVAIDEATYRTPPFVGLPKVMWTPQIARVQDAVLNAGATVFAWDVILPTSAGTYVADRRYDTPLLQSLFEHGKNRERVILGEAILGDQPVRPFPGFRQAVGGEKNIRALNAYVDPDGIVRGVPLVLREATGKPRPAMALEVAARHAGVAPDYTDAGGVVFAGYPVPTDEDGNMIVRFDTRAGAIPTYSFQDLAACAEAGEAAYFERHFAGKAVIFGTVLDIEDRKLASDRFARHPDGAAAPPACLDGVRAAGPVARNTTPGVYVHANAVENILTASAIRRAGLATRVCVVFALSLGAAVAAARRRPPAAAAWSAAAVAAYGVAAAWVFGTGVEWPLADPLAAAALTFTGTVSYRVLIGDRERRHLHETFKRYLDPKVIDAMLDRGELPALGGESRELTVFFSDIAKFSEISERMAPADLVRFLNAYFEVAGREIEARGGIIERFEGDAILAVFGAPVHDPDHARHAVEAAMGMDRALRAADGAGLFDIPGGLAVKTRIGVNTGLMTVGNVGSARRHSYTVMGDAVNLAARLESANKQFGTTILVGDETVAGAEATADWLEVDRVRVVGRARPVTLYAPLGPAGARAPGEGAFVDGYAAALARYRAGDFAGARDAFSALSGRDGDVAAKAAERCAARVDDDRSGWDGVTTLTNK